MTDQTAAPQPACAWCKHAAHHPGTECEAGVEHGPKRWHRCLCLNLVGADSACPPQMDCQGGTLGYSDAWHAQRRAAARTASGQQPETTPAPWIADGRHGPTPDEMRQAIAHALHRYDNQHALSGNDIPSKHHYGEADAVLAVIAAAQPDPTTADDPIPLRWGLGDVLWGDDDTVTVCLSGPAPGRAPYWLELDAERAAALRDDLTPPETHFVTDDSDDPEHVDDCPGCEAFSLTGHVAAPAVGQQPCACGHLQDRHLSCCTECPCIGYVPVWPPQTTGPAATPAVGQLLLKHRPPTGPRSVNAFGLPPPSGTSTTADPAGPYTTWTTRSSAPSPTRSCRC